MDIVWNYMAFHTEISCGYKVSTTGFVKRLKKN